MKSATAAKIINTYGLIVVSYIGDSVLYKVKKRLDITVRLSFTQFWLAWSRCFTTAHNQ
jgi:hypothetical protein